MKKNNPVLQQFTQLAGTLERASGTMRWNVSLGPVAQVGGVTASGDRAFTSTPPAAWDLQGGTQLWRATPTGVMLGGPTVGPDGQTVFVGGINAAGTAGTVAALSVATGAVVWQVDLEGAVMSPLDRLWAQDGLVVVPDLSGKVIVLDAETGAEVGTDDFEISTVTFFLSFTPVYKPSVAWDSTRNQYLVVWSEITGLGNEFDYELFARRLAADGTPLGRDTIECRRGNPPPWALR